MALRTSLLRLFPWRQVVPLIAALVAVAALAAGCHPDVAVDPGRHFTPSFATGTVIGEANIPIPPENGDPNGGQVDWFDTGISLPKAGFYRVTVNGTVNTTPNPAYEACVGQPWPYPGGSWGPFGINGTNELKVILRFDYTYWALGLSAPDVNSPTATNFGYYPAGTHLLAMRNGVSGGGSVTSSDGEICHANAYLMSGTQTITVEQVPLPVVHALKNPVTSSEVVTFVASLAPEITEFDWVYVGRDTLPTPMGAPTGDRIWSCSGQTSCSIPVSSSGRMYSMGNIAHSELVWVKDPPVRLTVSCSPSEVPAGGTTTCTAATAPAGQPLQIVEWFFVPDSATAHDQTLQALDCATENPCTTHVRANGTVYARATVAGIEQTAGAPVTRARPQLEVTASATLVHPGDTVVFTAQAPGASSVQVGSWSWVVDEVTAAAPNLATTTQPVSGRIGIRSTAAATMTSGCGTGLNPCIVPVTETGRMQVSATVDGEPQFAESPVVQVESPPPDSVPALTCPAQVERGAIAICQVAPPSASVIRWRVTAESVELGNPPDRVSSEREWSGPMVTSGTVSAVVQRGAGDTTLTAHIAVTPRPWTSSVPTVADSVYVRCPGPTRTGDCPLLDPPQGTRDRGISQTTPRFDQIAVEDSAREVTTGPNTGYSYLAGDAPYTFMRFRRARWGGSPCPCSS
ncbi:MAG: hypothetical protein IRZ00_16220 [Gemmatimonadetes bacterium]|nr:hypothetical protein [Gemmatimonadota bacterium]